MVRKRDKDEVLPPTMPDQNLGTFRFKRKYRNQKRKRGMEFVYELRDVSDENLASNPVPCSTTVVENAMASGEENRVASGEENPDAFGEEKPDEISKQISIECAKEINDHLHTPDESVNIGGSIVNEIILHEWKISNISRSKRGGDRVLQWAKKVVRDLDRTIRRIVRLYHVHLDDHDEVRMTRRARKNIKS